MNLIIADIVDMAGKKNFNEDIKELKERMAILEGEVVALKETNVKLEEKVALLEGRVAVAENVSEKLCLELDRLDQYHRRPSLIFRNAILPQNETQQAVEGIVKNVLEKELKLPDAVKDIDKLHRVGRVRQKGGKTTQDIIVRFKTHCTRYTVYKQRKKAKHVKIVPNLMKRRGKLLYDASTLVEKIEGVDFVFGNTHGDLNVFLSEPYEDKQIYNFSSLDDLKNLLDGLGRQAQ